VRAWLYDDTDSTLLASLQFRCRNLLPKKPDQVK
jgi:hypothetical protein